MITHELGSISLLSLVPFYIFKQSRVFGVFGEEKVSVKFTESKQNNKGAIVSMGSSFSFFLVQSGLYLFPS